MARWAPGEWRPGRWRRERCDGCFRRCRYLEFKVRPGARGGALLRAESAVLRVDEGEREKWKRKETSTLLGRLHQEKRAAWERFTTACREEREPLLRGGPRVYWVPRSANRKTGRIPCAYVARHTCPTSCPHREVGCYARAGHVRQQWDRTLGPDALRWGAFLERVAALPRGTPWRYAVAGDLPGRGDRLDVERLALLVEANVGRRGWAYTRKPLSVAGEASAVAAACAAGFAVNVSTDTPEAADAAMSVLGLPAVLVLPRTLRLLASERTPAGRRVVVCPALRSTSVTCRTCRLCADAAREVVVGFPAHGPGRRALSERLLDLRQRRLPLDPVPF